MKTYIEKQLSKKITLEMENKYRELFNKQARYVKNGIYTVPGTNLMSTDTRDLFLMFVAAKEQIPFKTE
jgi:hypothetical protein